ncbi:hypothetical protein Tco_1188565 [Tanacetum coccineum]
MNSTTYFLWMERNSRLFTKKILSVDMLVQSNCSTVRLKLVTFRFKKTSPTSWKLLDMWKVPKQCIVHNGSAGCKDFQGGWKLRRLISRLKLRSGEDFSYIRCVWPMVYQLVVMKKTSFLEMESNDSIVVDIPEIVED